MLPEIYWGNLGKRLSCSPCNVQQLWYEVSTAPANSSPADTYSCRFCPILSNSHVLATADEDGYIKLWDTRHSHSRFSQRLIAIKEAHNNAIYEIDFNSSGRHLYSCGGDRSVHQYDAQTLDTLSEFGCKNRTVKTLTCLPHDPNVLATGGRDGVIEVWDSRVTTRVSHQIHQVVNKQGRRRSSAISETTAPASVTSLVFRDENYLISAGSGSGAVSVWDLRRTYAGGGLRSAHTPVERFDWSPASHGVVAMTIDRCHGNLFVSRMHDVIQCYNTQAWQPYADGAYSGHVTGSYYVRVSVSADAGWLVSGGSDGRACLWRVGGATTEPVCLPAAATQHEVTCVAWSADGNTLATFCDDITFRLWRVDKRCGQCGDDAHVLADTRTSHARDVDNSGASLVRFIDWRQRGRRVPGAPVALNHRRSIASPASVGNTAEPARANNSSRTCTDGNVSSPAARAVTPRRLSARPSPAAACSSRTRRRSAATTRPSPAAAGSPDFLHSWLRRGSLSADTVAVRRSPRKRALPSPDAGIRTPPASTSSLRCMQSRDGSPGARVRSPRRLFCSDNSPAAGRLAVAPDLVSAGSRAGDVSPRHDSSHPGGSGDGHTDSVCSPGLAAAGCRRSPRKHVKQLALAATTAGGGGGSPTAGLPDWVTHRISPHRPHLSPLNGRRQRHGGNGNASAAARPGHTNWLTRLSRQRRSRCEPTPPTRDDSDTVTRQTRSGTTI